MNKEKYKVSVVIPVYNVDKYLTECLESVINQTLKEIEIILINDGSIDNSFKIIEKYQKIDNRIKVINQKNQGQSVARNNGLKLAKGEYIYFMDSDDFIDLDMFELCYEKSQIENLDFLTFDSEIIFQNVLLKKGREHLKKRKKDFSCYIGEGVKVLKKLNKNRQFSCSPCLHFVNFEYLKNNNLKFYPGIIHEDELFTFQLYLNAKRMSYINRKFFKRRLRENSTMTTPKSEKNIIGYLTVARELKKVLEFEKDVEKIKLINIRIADMINSAIVILNFLNKDLQIKYKQVIKSEFKNYLNIKSKIKLEYPKIFKKIKKIKEKVL